MSGIEFDEVRCDAEYAKTTEDLNLGSWTIPAGGVAGVFISWKGIVGGQTCAAALIFHHDDFFSRWREATAPEKVTQPHVRQCFTAQIDYAAFVGTVPLDREFKTLLNGAERNYVRLRVHFHREAIDDGQRQRKADGKGRPLALFAGHVDHAA